MFLWLELTLVRTKRSLDWNSNVIALGGLRIEAFTHCPFGRQTCPLAIEFLTRVNPFRIWRPVIRSLRIPIPIRVKRPLSLLLFICISRPTKHCRASLKTHFCGNSNSCLSTVPCPMYASSHHLPTATMDFWVALTLRTLNWPCPT